MQEKLQELIDRQAILDCVHRYTRGVDRHDSQLIASAFHADAIDDHGHFCGSPAGLIDYLNGTGDAPGIHAELFDDHLHFATNHIAEIDGDTAHAETYYLMVARHRETGQAGLWTGRYVDRFERRDGRWAIALRRVVPAAAQPILPGEGAAVLEGFAAAAWDRSDISYARPLAASTEATGGAEQ